MFNKLKEGGLTLKLSKKTFCTKEILYLGYKISEEGIKPNEEKIKAIKDFLSCKNLKQLQSFLGLCNFYRRFQKNYSDLTSKFKHILSKKINLFGDNMKNMFLKRLRRDF